MSSLIFNTEKSDYKDTPLFFGQAPGLLDSINQKQPKFKKLYKKLKSQDWDENEISFEPCKVEFETSSKTDYETMIWTIAWQWEQDSIAARSLGPVLSCFNPSSEIWPIIARITENEVLHGLTYSEIVRQSFNDPDEVFNQILSIKESFSRLKKVTEVIEEITKLGHEYALGLIPYSQHLYNRLFVYLCTIWMMERGQFIGGSFSITFAYGERGSFLPIAEIVKKICMDELEIHVEFGKLLITEMLNTGEGITALNQTRSELEEIFKEIYNSETTFIDFLVSKADNGKFIVDPELLKQEILYYMAPIAKELNIAQDFSYPTQHALRYMEEWTRIDASQHAPQEQRSGRYLLGLFTRDCPKSMIFDIDLLP
jgi:ribonucleoside-diphosphate reductase beta chain